MWGELRRDWGRWRNEGCSDRWDMVCGSGDCLEGFQGLEWVEGGTGLGEGRDFYVRDRSRFIFGNR